MNRILLEKDELDACGEALILGRRAKHVHTVLRARPGERVRVGIINGPCGTGRILSLDTADTMRLHCELDTTAPAATGIALLLALPRPKIMRRLWAPLASLGVERIILVNATKVERPYFDTHWLAPEVVRALLIEGLEQSGDTRLPEVRVCRRFKPFVEDDAAGTFGVAASRILCQPGNAYPPLAHRLGSGAVVFAIGPEGGWTPYELDLLRRHDFECATLGERTLRTDTAVLAVIGAALARGIS